jgi:hypothetical protein
MTGTLVGLRGQRREHETRGGPGAAPLSFNDAAPPVELRTRGTGGGTVLRFVAYDSLPLNAETEKLLSIAAQHPGAPVVRDAVAYRQLQQELFANG